MARYTSLDQLPERLAHLKVGDPIGSLNLTEFGHQPALLEAAAKFLGAAEKQGYTIVKEYATVALRKPLTEEQTAERLRDAQRNWDEREVELDLLKEFGTRPEHAYALKQWCSEEGVEYPTSEEVTNALY